MGYIVGIYFVAHQLLPQGVSIGDIGIVGLIAVFGLKKFIFDVLIGQRAGQKEQQRLRARSETVRAVLADIEASEPASPFVGLRQSLFNSHRLWLGGSISANEFRVELERVENAVKQHLQLGR